MALVYDNKQIQAGVIQLYKRHSLVCKRETPTERGLLQNTATTYLQSRLVLINNMRGEASCAIDEHQPRVVHYQVPQHLMFSFLPCMLSLILFNMPKFRGKDNIFFLHKVSFHRICIMLIVRNWWHHQKFSLVVNDTSVCYPMVHHICYHRSVMMLCIEDNVAMSLVD